MLVQFGNNWIQKIPLTAKLDSACGLVQFWLSSEFFSSNYFQIGQHVVLLHIQIALHSVQLPLYKSITIFAITEEFNARSLANLYGQYADRHMNLKFMRRVSERERATRLFDTQGAGELVLFDRISS